MSGAMQAWRLFLAGDVMTGVDIVHGHSSHHPRPVEVHEGRLILYGCGDLINDYKGIGGHERHRTCCRLEVTDAATLLAGIEAD